MLSFFLFLLLSNILTMTFLSILIMTFGSITVANLGSALQSKNSSELLLSYRRFSNKPGSADSKQFSVFEAIFSF